MDGGTLDAALTSGFHHRGHSTTKYHLVDTGTLTLDVRSTGSGTPRVDPPANISRITNDTEVPADLALFYEETSGANWPEQNGWFGLACDENRTELVGIGPIYGLNSQLLDLSFLFAHCMTLETLTFTGAGELQILRLDLCTSRARSRSSSSISRS